MSTLCFIGSMPIVVWLSAWLKNHNAFELFLFDPKSGSKLALSKHRSSNCDVELRHAREHMGLRVLCCPV